MRSAGSQIANYTLNAPLGQGAYGEVWAATSPRGPVAIKLLKKQEGWAVRRFEREAEVLARLDHPNCVQLLDYGVGEDGTPFIVTELLRGQTLAEWFWDQPAGTRIDLSRQIARAIEHAHRHHVVHRDLKPENIFIKTAAAGPQAKVLDFGLARLVNSSPVDITRTGEILGTPGYMSPEQLRADTVGPPADIYALGTIFFLLLEDRPPFEGDSMLDVAMQHLNAEVPTMSSHHRADLVRLTRRMLSKNPADRPTAREVVQQLEGRFEIAYSEDVPRRTNVRGLWLTAVIGAVAVLLGLGFMMRPSTPPPSSVRTSFGASATALLRQPDLGVQQAIDHGPGADPTPQVARPVGCGMPAEPGLHRIAGSTLDIFVRVPTGYDGTRPAPVLLLLHDIGQRPERLLETPDLIARADEDGFVIVAPIGVAPNPDLPIIREIPVPNTWLHDSDRQRVILDLEIAGEKFCLDDERVFAIGHGNGAVVAQWVACLRPIKALALTSHRWWGDRVMCTRGDPVPTIFLSPTDDPAAPVLEEEDCFGNMAKWPLAQHEEELQLRHKCSKKHRTVPAKHAKCFTAACEIDLEWCQVEGGRDWKSMPARKVTSGESEFGFTSFCASEKGDFDYVSAIWRFFEKHDGAVE